MADSTGPAQCGGHAGRSQEEEDFDFAFRLQQELYAELDEDLGPGDHFGLDSDFHLHVPGLPPNRGHDPPAARPAPPGLDPGLNDWAALEAEEDCIGDVGQSPLYPDAGSEIPEVAESPLAPEQPDADWQYAMDLQRQFEEEAEDEGLEGDFGDADPNWMAPEEGPMDEVVEEDELSLPGDGDGDGAPPLDGDHGPEYERAQLGAQLVWYIDHLLHHPEPHSELGNALLQLLRRGRDQSPLAFLAGGAEEELEEDDFDVDNMTYEQLLALREQIGVVVRGVSPEELQTSTTTRELSVTDIQQLQTAEEEQCKICFDDYAPRDTVRELACRHAYHIACIDRWLEEHRTCPLCKQEVVGPQP